MKGIVIGAKYTKLKKSKAPAWNNEDDDNNN